MTQQAYYRRHQKQRRVWNKCADNMAELSMVKVAETSLQENYND